MHDGNRSHGSALGGFLALVLLIGGAVTLCDNQGRGAGSNEATQQQDPGANPYIAPNAVVQAPPAEPQTSRNEWRQEQDLRAQRDMAKWAFIMLWVTGASVAVTSLGVVYVALTLQETRRAVKAADDAVAVTREIGNKQLRAYIGVASATAKFNWSGDASYRFVVTIKNYGATPASGVYFERRLDWSEDIDPQFEPFVLPAEHERIMSFQLPPGETHEIEFVCEYPEPEATRKERKMDPKYARLCYVGRVFYRTFDLKPLDAPRETGFLYIVPLPNFPMTDEPREMEPARKGNDAT